MKEITTTERLVRYVAFDNPGMLAKAATPLQEGGAEAAVVHFPMKNIALPHLTDGVYGEVVWHAGLSRWAGDVTSNMPDAARRQFRDHKTFTDLDEAVRWMVAVVSGEVGRIQHQMRLQSENIAQLLKPSQQEVSS